MKRHLLSMAWFGFARPIPSVQGASVTLPKLGANMIIVFQFVVGLQILRRGHVSQ